MFIFSFQKNTSVNGLTEATLIRKPESQPFAKRQRNDTSAQQCDKNTPSYFQKPTECLDNDVNFIAGAEEILKNPLVKPDLVSSSFTSIKKTDPDQMVSKKFNSSKDGRPHLTNGIKPFTRQGCVNIQSSELNNGIGSLGTPISIECMDLSDDFIIPPTPPVTNFKNKAPMPCSVIKKGNKNVFSGPDSEDNHIKKSGIRNSLRRNLSNSKHVNAKKVDFSGNKSVVEPLDKTLTGVADSSEIKSNGNSLRNSSFKLARKTYKLSKKGKKVETGKLPLSNEKSESGEVNGVDKNCGILSGYGVVCNGLRSDRLIKCDDYDDNDDFKNNKFKVK